MQQWIACRMAALGVLAGAAGAWAQDVPRILRGAGAGEFDPGAEVGPVPPLAPPGAADLAECWSLNGLTCWEGKRVGIGVSSANYPLQVASGTSLYAGVFQSLGANSRGIYGASLTPTGQSYGGVFQSMSATGVGVYGLAASATGQNFGVYGVTNSAAGWAGYFAGRGYFAGSVGIGTTTPLAGLHIEPGAGDATVFLRGAGQSSGYLLDAGSGGLSFATFDGSTAAPRVAMDFSGNVGIGTAAPGAKLDVRGSVRVGDGTTAAQDISVAAGGGTWRLGSDAGGNGTGGNQFFVFDATASAYAVTVQNGTGRVGVGTAAPTAKLHVMDAGTGGSVRITGDDPILVLENTGTSGHNFSIYAKDGDLQLRDAQAGAARLLIDTSGKIGIGTASPNFDLQVVGTITATTKNFVIDHPSDPTNKVLVHSCVESNEYKNIYDGTVRTDAAGYATVTLPEWFGALNENFRYQLTVVDEKAPDPHFVRIARKIGSGGAAGNQFTIKSLPGNMEVCWQVTGTRKDVYAKAHPLVIEQVKSERERGRFLNPVEWGRPAEMGVQGR